MNSEEWRRIQRSDEWLVASRRHIGGAGDLLAVLWLPFPYMHLVRLIEVKKTRRPYDHFLPEDRAALLAEAEEYQRGR
jgi:hypothetical protein